MYSGTTASNLTNVTTTGAPAGVGELTVLLASWRPHLEAAGLSPRAVRGYTDDGALFAAFLVRKGTPPRSQSSSWTSIQPVRLPKCPLARPRLHPPRRRARYQSRGGSSADSTIRQRLIAEHRFPCCPTRPCRSAWRRPPTAATASECGTKGLFTASGMYQLIKDRGNAAGPVDPTTSFLCCQTYSSTGPRKS